MIVFLFIEEEKDKKSIEKLVLLFLFVIFTTCFTRIINVTYKKLLL